MAKTPRTIPLTYGVLLRSPDGTIHTVGTVTVDHPVVAVPAVVILLRDVATELERQVNGS